MIIVFSIVFAASFNTIREEGIPWKAKPIEKVEDTSFLQEIINEPVIREIGLEVAVALHREGSLFVDARAEEYLIDGYIPGAIANDDVGKLSNAIDSLNGFDKGFVIYCSDDDCGSSEDLAYDLQDMGFNNILVFKGGWKMWSEANLGVEYND